MLIFCTYQVLTAEPSHWGLWHETTSSTADGGISRRIPAQGWRELYNQIRSDQWLPKISSQLMSPTWTCMLNWSNLMRKLKIHHCSNPYRHPAIDRRIQIRSQSAISKKADLDSSRSQGQGYSTKMAIREHNKTQSRDRDHSSAKTRSVDEAGTSIGTKVSGVGTLEMNRQFGLRKVTSERTKHGWHRSSTTSWKLELETSGALTNPWNRRR